MFGLHDVSGYTLSTLIFMFSLNVMYMNISLFVIKHTNCQMCFQFKLCHSKWSSKATFEYPKDQALKQDHATAQIS